MVSIIIPCREIDADTKRCIEHCERLPEEKEIIVVPDSVCPGYPALKRNMAMRQAKGEVFAFIDSDAYPAPYWLDMALTHLKDHDAVCGPGVLPPDADMGERAADLVLQNLPYAYRVVPRRPRVVAEYPTFNLVVKREAATEFDYLLTGEDSLFCRRIKTGVYYHPWILVYHSRRPLYKRFWRQIGTYGRHRGYLIRLAVMGWISAVFVYAVNFIKGLFVRRPS